MKRVLCISPHFPPINAPDMHRIRHALPHLREFGWDPVVFAVDPDQIEMARDPLLSETIPRDIEIQHVGATSASLTRKFGLGNIGFRCWFQLRRAVSAYLSRHPVDLIFFSTTVFTAIAHGPYWRRRFGTPFVVDLQDPWRNDYYLTIPPDSRPPKFWFDYRQKKYFEAHTMPTASGVVAVSRDYVETIIARYPVLGAVPNLVQSFGVEESDFLIAAKRVDVNVLPTRPPSTAAIVFTGVVPPSMHRTIRLLFRATRRLEERCGAAPPVRFYFIGTKYAQSDAERVEVVDIARECGIADLVVEEPTRRPYFEALRMMQESDALLLLGTDDQTYSPSKVAPYVLSGRPIFSIFHRESNMIRTLREIGTSPIVEFDESATDIEIEARIELALTEILDRLPFTPTYDPLKTALLTGREKTRCLAQFFDEVVSRVDRHDAATSVADKGNNAMAN